MTEKSLRKWLAEFLEPHLDVRSRSYQQADSIIQELRERIKAKALTDEEARNISLKVMAYYAGWIGNNHPVLAYKIGELEAKIAQAQLEAIDKLFEE